MEGRSGTPASVIGPEFARCRVTALLDSGQDPAESDSQGRKAYWLCKFKSTRDAFRRHMAAHPDACDWNEAGVHEALTPEQEALRAKKKVGFSGRVTRSTTALPATGSARGSDPRAGGSAGQSEGGVQRQGGPQHHISCDWGEAGVHQALTPEQEALRAKQRMQCSATALVLMNECVWRQHRR